MALLIGHNLYLNVMRRRDELLHVALAVAKNGLALGTRLDERLCRVFHALDLANTATATAGTRLDEHGTADALGLGRRLLGAFEQIAARRAASLSPMLSITSAEGPTNARPYLSQSRTKLAFSEKKP